MSTEFARRLPGFLLRWADIASGHQPFQHRRQGVFGTPEPTWKTTGPGSAPVLQWLTRISAYNAAMRIIAGQYRGRNLVAPPGEDTRPILDRAKCVLFDWLGSRLAQPGYLPPINVLDLFAGAGTLGFECLSRGAAWACFVEKHSLALKSLYANAAMLRADSACRIVRGDALAIRILPPPVGRFSLVFVDPPYRLTDRPEAGDAVVRRLAELGGHPAVADDAILVFRQDRRAQPLPAIEAWPMVERREVGSMVFTILGRSAGVERDGHEGIVECGEGTAPPSV